MMVAIVLGLGWESSLVRAISKLCAKNKLVAIFRLPITQ